MYQTISSAKFSLFYFLAIFVIITSSLAVTAQVQTYPQQPVYTQGYDPTGQQQQDENYSTKSPYKLEIAKLEATVYRPGEEPIPLSQIPRLNKGDVLKIKISNEPVNGIMPHQSNWDWSLAVAFINPSRNNSSEETLSQEIRLREKGWYNDNFFTVPYDSQPIIFLYPKANYRKKILELLEKRPDDIRQMGEKVIEISSAYGYISSFLSQAQYMLTNPYYSNGLLEQSIEGMARTFNIQLPSCWQSGGYGGSYYGGTYSTGYGASGFNSLAYRSQCLSQNVRVEDLNYSVGRMLQQGGLVALARLQQIHPEISKWVALAAIAIDFIMKLTNRTAIRIIPAIVSTPDNPIFTQQGFYGGGGFNNGGGYNTGGNYYQGNTNNYYQGNTAINGFTSGAANGFTNGSAQPSQEDESKVSLLANYQPSDKSFVTVYAYVPHKWEAEPEPKLANLVAPQLIDPCFHSGKNLLRNMDLRIEWLSDNFTRDFKLILDDKNGWKKEFPLRKNLGLNAWEVEISKDDISALPKNNVFEAKITGKRGFTIIESPTFEIPITNNGTFEATITPSSSSKNIVTVKRLTGDARCSQNIVYKSAAGQPIIFPITKENSFLKFTEDKSQISFEVDASAQPATDTIQIQLYGGELLNAIIKQ